MKLFLSDKKDYVWSWGMLTGQPATYYVLRLSKYCRERNIIASDEELMEMAEVMHDYQKKNIDSLLNYFWVM